MFQKVMRLQLLRSTIARRPPIPSTIPLPSKFSSCCRSLHASFNAATPSIDFSKCGFDRPDTILWQKSLENHVNLIGLVGDHVKSYLMSGSAKAVTSLKVAKPTTEGEHTWFKLEFWNELADIAAAHLKRDDHIFVSGSLVVVDVVGRDNSPKRCFKITVRDLKYVLTNNLPDVEAEHFQKTQSQSGAQKSNSKEDWWQDYFNNPSQWWDNRFCKTTQRHPDFINKTTNNALWVSSSSTPAWVKDRLQERDSTRTFEKKVMVVPCVDGRRSTSKATAQLTSLWQAYFANPFEWWDNRGNKITPLYPDFKHKTTGEALWINSYSNPGWVKSQLAALHSKSHVERGKRGGLFSSKEPVNPRSTFRDEDLDIRFH